jgi:hypothetical protein
MKSFKPKANLDLYKWKKTVLDLVKDLKECKTEKNIDRAKLALKTVLDKEEKIKHFTLRWMEQSSWFRHLPTEVALEGLLHAIKNNDPVGAKIIVQETQKKAPLHPELPTFTLENGEKVVHLIARSDKEKVLKELTKLNPFWGSIKDKNGDTPLHIASKYISVKTLLSIGKRYPELLILRNKKGLRPIDLESGPLILKHIPKKEIATRAINAKRVQREAKRQILKATTALNSIA